MIALNEKTFKIQRWGKICINYFALCISVYLNKQNSIVEFSPLPKDIVKHFKDTPTLLVPLPARMK